DRAKDAVALGCGVMPLRSATYAPSEDESRPKDCDDREQSREDGPVDIDEDRRDRREEENQDRARIVLPRGEACDDQQRDPERIGVAGEAGEYDRVGGESHWLAPTAHEERERQSRQRPQPEPQRNRRQGAEGERQIRGVGRDAHFLRACRWRYTKNAITTSGNAIRTYVM